MNLLVYQHKQRATQNIMANNVSQISITFPDPFITLTASIEILLALYQRPIGDRKNKLQTEKQVLYQFLLAI